MTQISYTLSLIFNGILYVVNKLINSLFFFHAADSCSQCFFNTSFTMHYNSQTAKLTVLFNLPSYGAQSTFLSSKTSSIQEGQWKFCTSLTFFSFEHIKWCPLLHSTHSLLLLFPRGNMAIFLTSATFLFLSSNH